MTAAMEPSRGPGDLLANRYRLGDLLHESHGGRYLRARDLVLSRDVAVHVIAVGDPRADALLAAARRSAGLTDRRILRVLDADLWNEVCYVVTEWADGTSLDV
ncbi:MAG: protein kinase family protein, partial [Nocardioides sp.]